MANKEKSNDILKRSLFEIVLRNWAFNCQSTIFEIYTVKDVK